MKYVLIQTIFLCALPVAFAHAESTTDSYVQTHVFSDSTNGGYVESHIETSGNSEVRVRTVINGEVVRDIHLQNGETEQTREMFTEELQPIPHFEFTKVDILPENTNTVDIEVENVLTLLRQLRIPEDFFLERAEDISSSLEDKEKPTAWVASIFQAMSSFIQKIF